MEGRTARSSACNGHGSLTIVGTGIRAVGQITLEALGWLKQADVVLHLVGDPATEMWIKTLNPREESLRGFYSIGKRRIQTYVEIADHIVSKVEEGLRVCVAFYGHPGAFVYASHRAIERVNGLGLEASMLPGISAVDCLFADLSLDPASSGCQLYDATDFILFDREPDTSSALILLQPAAVGDLGYFDGIPIRRNVAVLAEVLEAIYGSDHACILYEAAQYPTLAARVEERLLHELADCHLTTATTIYIPPRKRKEPDLTMLRRLGISIEEFRREAV